MEVTQARGTTIDGSSGGVKENGGHIAEIGGRVR